jgi:phosphatidylserine/phosphatidylglycerophosphate/cardiolipin synthase-like enzyme
MLAALSFQDLHHTRSFRNSFISALSDPIESIVICSPFFDGLPEPFKDIFGFCAFMQRRGTEKIQIITRPPGCDRQAMTLETAKSLAAHDVEIFIRKSPYLHAKMYHFEYMRGNFRSFVGSANFTLGGFERNYEIVAEMHGAGKASPCHREIAQMQSTGAVTFQAWIQQGQPRGPEEAL